MDFRGGFDCFSSKSKELNVEKIIGNGRKDAQNENKELNLKLISVKSQNSFLVSLQITLIRISAHLSLTVGNGLFWRTLF